MTATSLPLVTDPGSFTHTFSNGMFDDNLQEQRDEILALQSIFTEGDEKLKILTEVNKDNEGIFALYITICVKPMSDSLQVSIALPTKQDENIEAAAPVDDSSPPVPGPNVQLNRSGQCWQSSFSLKYLSPLYLQVTLPPSYPSQDPPQFHISCDWLTMDKLTSVSHEMDTLWSEGCQMPVIYNWVYWLENNILSHLGITNHLVLQPSIPETEAGENVVESWHKDVGEIIACLIDYNQEQMDIEFCQTVQECHVCYCEKPGEQFFRMHDCQHHYCNDCMAEFCEMHVREGTVEALRCPDRECNTIIPPYIVQAVLGAEAYQRWEQLLLQKTLDAMSDTVYCPRCNSLVIAETEEELHLAQCPVCYFAFCTECNSSWHQGRKCVLEVDLLIEVQKRMKADMKKEEEQRYQDWVRTMEEEIESKMTVTANSKKCPHCRIPVQKNDGCNKMTCKCGKRFCWMCGQAVENNFHFTGGSCTLVLPDDLEGNNQVVIPLTVRQNIIRRPVQRRAEGVHQIEARIAENQNLANNRVFCPVCKQLNLKELDRNNHIKCWNCKVNFCFQCRKRIMDGNVKDHFKGSCVQHS